MKRLGIFLSILLMVLCLYGCAANGTVKSGTYLLDGQMESPYIYINADSTYMQGAALYASFADFGTYTVEGATLTLSSDNRETVICLTIEENGALTVKNCENEMFGLKTGDRFLLWEE